MPITTLPPDTENFVLHSRGGKFSPKTLSQIPDVARVLNEAANAAPENGLVIHFHGGLVPEEDALSTVPGLTKVYRDAGAYPLFFVWESGVVETIRNNPDDLLADPAFQALVKKVSEWVLKGVGGGAGFRGASNPTVDESHLNARFNTYFYSPPPTSTPPISDSEVTKFQVEAKGAAVQSPANLSADINAGIQSDLSFQQAMQDAFSEQATGIPRTTAAFVPRLRVIPMSAEAKAAMFGLPAVPTAGFALPKLSWLSVAQYVAQIVIAVFKRYRDGKDHGAYCTIVEEVVRSVYGDLLGGAIWDMMKKDTEDSFKNSPNCCGSEVITQLSNRIQRFRQVTLVGHSAGCIYVCNFLEALNAQKIEVPIKVVFLAPAVTCDKFAQTISTLSQSNYLANFRQFTMQDEAECNDQVLGLLYTRSLLYVISGILEGNSTPANGWKPEIDRPIVGMARYLNNSTYDTDANVLTVRKFLMGGSNRLVLSPVTGGPGLNSHAKHHQDFDDDIDTRVSIQNFIR